MEDAMNTCSKALIACGVALLCGYASWGQDSSTTSGFVFDRANMRSGILGPAPDPIVGEPYSADTETTDSQTLADGTHIEGKVSSSREYRDSQGRTRTERYMAAQFAGGEWEPP